MSDFSDIEDFFEKGRMEVRAKVEEIGREVVEYARENGNYHDRSGRLRASNFSETDEDASLLIGNTAPYASGVESRGYEVVSGAAIYAEKRLKETFGE